MLAREDEEGRDPGKRSLIVFLASRKEAEVRLEASGVEDRLS